MSQMEMTPWGCSSTLDGGLFAVEIPDSLSVTCALHLHCL